MPNSQPASPHLKGTVLAHNISPRGHVEGALIETENGLAQLNVGKHGNPVAVGAMVDVAVEREDGAGDHPVFTAMVTTGAAGGVIARLNYALHGEPNGYVLGDGTFVHVKPDDAKKYTFKVGDRITATGPVREGNAARVIDADTVSLAK